MVNGEIGLGKRESWIILGRGEDKRGKNIRTKDDIRELKRQSRKAPEDNDEGPPTSTWRRTETLNKVHLLLWTEHGCR